MNETLAPVQNGSGSLRSTALDREMSACRRQIAAVLAESISGWDKFAAELEADREGFIDRELLVFADYLILLFRTGDETFRSLYIGEKRKQLYDPRDSHDAARERRNHIVASEHQRLIELFRPRLDPASLECLDRELDLIARAVCAETKTLASVLLIGDCLFIDLISFLTGPLLEAGITLQPSFLTDKNPLALQKEIRARAGEKFDAVFYSPFTYEFSLAYAPTQRPQLAFASRAEISGVVEASIAEVERTLDLIADLFECNVFVHNSANIRRHDGTWSDRGKGALTAGTRRAARHQVNTWLREYLPRKNAASFPHLFEIDETRVLDSHSEDELGKYFYHSDLQHPAVMGRALAPVYEEILRAQMQLLKVKLIVCDLDNTLWDGVIGEGDVRHFHDRQQVLQALRTKGVVLAVCSKNDPHNVHFRGGTLGEDDFVASLINWDSKPSNIRRIAKELNLKTKDFLFLDDRADERGLVEIALPEVRTMDPTDARTWDLLARWAELLPAQTELDRTQFYKQREQRQQFLESSEVESEHEELLAQLELRIAIRTLEKADIARAVELINRTNQFNLCGSRTSIRELTQWHQSEDWTIFAVDAADKFGEMGTISILVFHRLTDRIEIPVFVLSCRVFGYGMEIALLNSVKMAAETNGLAIHGLYRETPNNEPCRKVYPQNGFEWAEERWVYRGGAPVSDPRWLSISREQMRNLPGVPSIASSV